MKYRTIVADPPWPYGRRWANGSNPSKGFTGKGGPRPLPYPTMTLDEIAALPVSDLIHGDGAHLYLWTTNRFLPDTFRIVEAWGFTYSQMLVWAKTPAGKGPGGAFAQNAEYAIFARAGLPITNDRVESVWFNWKRTSVHSRKPPAFLDLVEQVSPGPYVELFSRETAPRFGWDYWGDQSLGTAEMAA